jgi:hypothetical protein
LFFRQAATKSYNDVETEEDTAHTNLPFTPRRRPGPHLGRLTRAGAEHYTRAMDFFCLFFSTAIVTTICDNTNIYGWLHIMEKTTYRNGDNGWDDVSPVEFHKFLGLILYMGIVKVQSYFYISVIILSTKH